MPKVIADLENRILDRARGLFLQEGYQGLTIRKVAAECGVAVGTVYNYYPSKERLIVAVMLEDWHTALSRMQQGTQEAPAALEGLYAVYCGIRSFAEPYLSVWKCYSETAGMPQLGRERHDRLVVQLGNVIEPLLVRFRCLLCESLPQVLAELLLSAAVWEQDGFERLRPILFKLLT